MSDAGWEAWISTGSGDITSRSDESLGYVDGPWQDERDGSLFWGAWVPVPPSSPGEDWGQMPVGGCNPSEFDAGQAVFDATEGTYGADGWQLLMSSRELE